MRMSFTGFAEWFVNVFFWLQAFAGPVIVFGLISLMSNSIFGIIVLLSVGVISGIILAEFIRKRYGLDNFFARIYGPNEMDREKDPPKP